MQPDLKQGSRTGEALAALAGAVLLVLMFALKWYGPGVIAAGHRAATSVNGWDGLLHLHWLMLVTIAAVLLLPLVRLAALPRRGQLVVNVAVLLLTVATLLWLGYRVLISVPVGERWPAYIGLGCALFMFLGSCMALRDAASAPAPDAPAADPGAADSPAPATPAAP